TNAAGATLNLSSTYGTPINYYNYAATLNNAGTLNQNAAGYHYIGSNITFNNTGTVNVNAGTLTYNPNLTNQGTISIAPGARMSIGGSFTNSAQATVRVGLGNATTIGVLAVTGTATLNGTLDVYLDGGYVPAASAIFGVITYLNRTGTFSVLRGESPGAQVDFSIDTASDPKTLKVKNVNVTTVLPGVDLIVTGLGMSTSTVLQSGNPVTVVWQDSNTGTLATSSSWIDRLVVTNTATNEVIADIQVPYDATVNGTLAGGSSLARQATFVLPQGNRGAGNFSFTVTTDMANTVTEINNQGLAENNNITSITLASALAPYADLVVTDVAPTPSTGWLAGDAVTVAWKTCNQGTGATSGSWTETLLVRNSTTGLTLFTQNVSYDAATLGAIAAGGLTDRSLTFAWPTGTNSSGQIEFTVTTDVSNLLFENNSTNTAESNNASKITVLSSPDLTVSNLSCDTPAPKSGDLITLSWNDVNSGNAAINAGWYDRIKVTNQSTGAVLVDQQLRYDPPVGGTLQAGTSATRSYSFRLADGNPGVGNLLMQVFADQTTAGSGSLYEVNAAGTAESNNSASLNLASVLAPYADLVAENLTTIPTSNFQPGQQVIVSWNTVNLGTKAADQAWSERVEVRNLTTNTLVATILLSDDLSSGVLDANQTRARTTQFNWPVGVSASGRFSIKVVVDSASQIFEANASGTGESNNTLELINDAGSDMQVRNLNVVTSAVQAGGAVGISWEDWNLGANPASISFNDRIVVRNLDNNLVLLDTTLAYDPLAITSGQVNGIIQPNESRLRNFNFQLPDGVKGTGNIGITVTADQNSSGVGVLFESNSTNNAETNNAASTSVVSVAKLYPDLQVTGITVDPPNGWTQNSQVNLHWRVTNTGNGSTLGPWADQVQVKNLTTNQTFYTNAIIYDAVTNGPVAAGGYLDRSATITWPQGITSVGRFQFSVLTDSAGQVIEINAPDINTTDTAETNNSTSLIIVSAPDLQVVNLHTTPTTAQAGSDLTIQWDDTNTGLAPTPAGWFDHVVVTNVTTGEQLVNTAVYYDPASAGNAPIGNGQAQARAYTFRLPEGLRGTGQLQITVTADQNTAGTGSLFESDRSNDTLPNNAESNNAASTSIVSQAKPYADLNITDLTIPATANAGGLANISWTVSNAGQASTQTGWTDRIVLSADGVIGNGDDVVLANVLRTTALNAGDSYTQTASVRIPTRISGSYRIAVVADALSAVLEPDTRANNTRLSGAVTIAVTYADLTPTVTLAPVEATAGRNTHVEWSVSNLGTIATDVNLWVDQLYLSTSATLDSSAILLGSLTHVGYVDSNGSYASAMDVVLPRTLNGQ
ncbi:MAG: CARDB domain-containing protein, partial [Gallionella sp.]